jgi:hypothetical protein
MVNFAGITFVAVLPPIVAVVGTAASSHEMVAWAPGTIKSTRISPAGFLHRAWRIRKLRRAALNCGDEAYLAVWKFK